MYQANKWFVKAAYKDARGKTKDDIGKMIALYEGETEQEVQDEETNS